MCFNACDNQFKQRDVNPLFWMKVSEYSDNGITNNIQEICMARFPRFITPKEQIIWSTPTYLSKHIYNTHKIIAVTINITFTNKLIQIQMWQLHSGGTTHAQVRYRTKYQDEI